MNIIESNLKFKSLIYGNVPNKIILHHAEIKNCTIQDIHEWHLANGWSGCGYHFLVRKDGTIYRGRPENAIGSHCKGSNTGSIGICAEGDYRFDIMPQAQKNAIIELCLYLKNKYNIKQLYKHSELFNTDCPSKNYPFMEIKMAVLQGAKPIIANIKLDGGSHGDDLNLIIRNFSKEVVKCYGYVDSDLKPSFAFAINPVNANYTKLEKNCSKLIKNHCGNSFSSGAAYKVRVDGYSKDDKKICSNTITIKTPKIEDKLYRVQVGAYKEKVNAEKTLKELKDKGFQGYIK